MDVTVYRKPMHNNHFLSSTPFDPFQVKRGFVRCLLDRVACVTSKKSSIVKEDGLIATCCDEAK